LTVKQVLLCDDNGEGIDENCYSQTIKQILLCGGNEEGIDEIVILSQSNKFFLCGGNEEGIDENRYSLTVKEALRLKVIIRHYRCILHV
jgi:hypothetical protein